MAQCYGPFQWQALPKTEKVVLSQAYISYGGSTLGNYPLAAKTHLWSPRYLESLEEPLGNAGRVKQGKYTLRMTQKLYRTMVSITTISYKHGSLIWLRSTTGFCFVICIFQACQQCPFITAREVNTMIYSREARSFSGLPTLLEGQGQNLPRTQRMAQCIKALSHMLRTWTQSP